MSTTFDPDKIAAECTRLKELSDAAARSSTAGSGNDMINLQTCAMCFGATLALIWVLDNGSAAPSDAIAMKAKEASRE